MTLWTDLCAPTYSPNLAQEMQVRQIMKEQDRFQDLHSACWLRALNCSIQCAVWQFYQIDTIVTDNHLEQIGEK